MYDSILKLKTHNTHFLNRYIKLIKYYTTNPILNKNTEYTEIHHICPKAKDMFPEYSNLKNHPWNAIKLPFRVHIIAHYLLMKSYQTQSQILSVIFTSGQKHNKKIYNSKLISIARKQLSLIRKGIFTRGYNEDGTAKVSKETKEKLSNIKKEYYSNPENRKKQSVACKNTTGRKSEKYSLSAKNRTEEHIRKISEGVKKHFEHLSEIDRKRINKGIYKTPFGNFSFTKFASYCINSNKKITIHNCKSHSTLLFQRTDLIGKTFENLGFSFIPKNDPTISQYYDDLNRVHQLEPNHPLSSELNDYLSHEKLHP